MNIYRSKQTNLPLTFTPARAALILSLWTCKTPFSNRGSDTKAEFDISHAKQVIAPVQRLLEHFRTVGAPVIFTWLSAKPAPLLFPGIGFRPSLSSGLPIKFQELTRSEQC